MAAGDFVWFDQGLLDLGNKVHNLGADTLQMGVINNTSAPTQADADPHWGGAGTTDHSLNQVATTEGYTAPFSVSPCTWTLVAGEPVLAANADPVIAQGATTGFTDGYWGILYNFSDASKRALGYIDLGGPKSIRGGPLTINLDSAGGASTKMLKIANP